jgi:hypothetical protein
MRGEIKKWEKVHGKMGRSVFSRLIFAAVYTAILRTASQRWPVSKEREQTLSILWAESVDAIIAIAFGILCLGQLRRHPLQ